MSTHTILWYREENGVEVEYEVTGTVSPVVYGRKYGPPEDCQPDEGGEVEIIGVERDGVAVTANPFTKVEEDEILSLLAEQAAFAEDDYEDDDDDEDYGDVFDDPYDVNDTGLDSED